MKHKVRALISFVDLSEIESIACTNQLDISPTCITRSSILFGGGETISWNFDVFDSDIADWVLLEENIYKFFRPRRVPIQQLALRFKGQLLIMIMSSNGISSEYLSLSPSCLKILGDLNLSLKVITYSEVNSTRQP
jgi:hypothetical protein